MALRPTYHAPMQIFAQSSSVCVGGSLMLLLSACGAQHPAQTQHHSSATATPPTPTDRPTATASPLPATSLWSAAGNSRSERCFHNWRRSIRVHKQPITRHRSGPASVRIRISSSRRLGSALSSTLAQSSVRRPVPSSAEHRDRRAGAGPDAHSGGRCFQHHSGETIPVAAAAPEG
jgi:hypothetical protein